MTTTSPAATPASGRALSPRVVMQIILSLTIPLGIVAAAVGPRRAALGLASLPPVHLHAPDFGLVAHAPLAIQRTLGWVWVVAMMTGAVSSLFIRIINHGSLSYIHLLAGWTIVALPMAVYFARTHKVRTHARFMTGLFTGGLILAGLLAFMPGRLMWNIWFS
jgi:uncharacterized membrane protein